MNRPSSSCFAGYTIIEMLLTVAILVIVLGLMVSLARYVRDESSHQLTRELLNDFERLMNEYRYHNHGAVPPVPSILRDDGAVPEEASIAEACRRNNEQVVQALREDYRRWQTSANALADPFESQPLSVYDRLTLRDSWGSPIVFMPTQHPLIGMAPSLQGQDQPFFFSAGPDRKYLSRDDNLYSYESGPHAAR